MTEQPRTPNSPHHLWITCVATADKPHQPKQTRYGKALKQRSDTMRFAVFVKATKDSEAGIMPTPDQLAEMDKYNEEMVKAEIRGRRRRASTELEGCAHPLVG